MASRSTCERVGVAELLHADADGVLPVVAEIGRVGFGAELGVADILHLDDAAGGVLDYDVVKLLRVGEAADDVDGDLIGLLLIGRGLADLACGNFDVLLAECVDDVRGGEAACSQLVGIEPDAHGVLAFAEDDDVTDARDALKGIFDVDVDVVADKEIGVAPVRVR